MPNNKKPSVHTVPNPEGGWDNQQDGKVMSHGETKADAQKLGRQQAMKDKTEHVIHNKDGIISESNSYGNDPFPPRG
ncbi:hypothetical protein J23TS9_51110 [Paenibacillus sp. J23TS9]|uniref:DUF2188 domain-containing protein n=1 Tax=Paenibacillus TaxID=44249 RepID=UPI0010A7E46F|nr:MULTISPECIES: DUF2188 domain-containing protein [Paenibacillus]GIP29981.1 hypothetical protein J23TS9_51110 [Paenibacillus sp. J23TS9]